jgi:hypothetical protein
MATNTKQRPMVAAVAYLVIAPIMTLGLYAWAKDVADGKRVETRRASRQAVADGIESVLGVIGPGGALAVGGLATVAAIAYFVVVLRGRNETTKPAAAEPAATPARFAKPAATRSGPAKCPHCSAPLTSSERTRAACPVCRRPLT